MTRLLTLLALLATPLSLRADDKPDRAAQMKAVRADLAKAQSEFRAAIKAGTVKPDDEGDYSGWADVLKRFVKPTRAVIDADPADALGLEALLFALSELGATDADLFALALKHHAASEKIRPLLSLDAAPIDFLRDLAAKSPHLSIRLWSRYHQAQQLVAAGKPKDAEKLLLALAADADAKEAGGYSSGTLADTASRLLFEIRNLNVGQEAPELAGEDLDGKPLKLSDSRGKVTLLVFWSAGCVPCMAMVPHEVTLVNRYAGRPFTIVGVNGDILAGGNFVMNGRDGKPVDGTAKLKVLVEKNKITWRSFRHGQWGTAENEGVGETWNVRSWPTIYLLDEAGVIRGKWKGDPGAKVLDAAVEKYVKVAEAK